MLSGVTKLFGGVTSDALLSPLASSALACAECLVAVCIAIGAFTRPCAWFAVALALGGVVLALFFPRVKCGCFGPVLLDPRHRLALAATLGVCAVLLLESDRDRVKLHRDSSHGRKGESA